jgi:prevent-host-death family protein
MQAKQRKPTRSRRTDAPAGALPVWNLEDAKARFSELVRQARDRGPQRVTVRGQDAVVVVSAADYARLAPAASKTTLAALFADGPFSRLDDFEVSLIRERAPSRDLPDF